VIAELLAGALVTLGVVTFVIGTPLLCVIAALIALATGAVALKRL
jgi:hypothetical protein